MKNANTSVIAEVVKGYHDGEHLIGDNRSAVRDILTDLINFCREEGFDFHTILESARSVDE